MEEGSNGGEFAYGVPAWAFALLTIPIAACALTAVLIGATVRSGSALARAWGAACVVANVGALALLAHWKLLGYQL